MGKTAATAAMPDDANIVPRAERYEDIMRTNLLVIAQVYADAMKWSLATVSKQIHGNQAFFTKFATGEASTTLKSYFAMVDRFKERWPANTKWPETVPVPELGKNIDN